MPSPPREAGEADALQRAAHRAVHRAQCGWTWQAPSSAQSWRSASTQVVSAIGPSTASTMSARLIAAGGRARRKPPPVPRARRAARRRQPADQLLRGRQRQAGLRRQHGRAERRASAAMARGGGHHHDGIIGKAGKAHIAMSSNRSDSIRLACGLEDENKPSECERAWSLLAGAAAIRSRRRDWPLSPPPALSPSRWTPSGRIG